MQERFGDLYTEDNVAISGTHTHSGPAGYLQYVLYQITSLGFVKQSWQALVDGAFEVSCSSVYLVPHAFFRFLPAVFLTGCVEQP